MSIEGHDQIVHYPDADYFNMGTGRRKSLFKHWINVRSHKLQHEVHAVCTFQHLTGGQNVGLTDVSGFIFLVMGVWY